VILSSEAGPGSSGFGVSRGGKGGVLFWRKYKENEGEDDVFMVQPNTYWWWVCTCLSAHDSL